jgi:hypothetical protein
MDISPSVEKAQLSTCEAASGIGAGPALRHSMNSISPSRRVVNVRRFVSHLGPFGGSNRWPEVSPKAHGELWPNPGTHLRSLATAHAGQVSRVRCSQVLAASAATL